MHQSLITKVFMWLYLKFVLKSTPFMFEQKQVQSAIGLPFVAQKVEFFSSADLQNVWNRVLSGKNTQLIHCFGWGNQ